MIGPLPIQTFLSILVVSLIVSGAFVLLHPVLLQYLRERDDLNAVQCVHLRATPRVGGVGIIVAVLTAFLVVIPDQKQLFFSLFTLTLVPVFAAGLSEDLGWRINATGRLLAAASSALLAVILLQLWIPPLALPGVDLLLGFAPVAIGITIIWATGVCHAMNLIDGVNGLAGATGILIAAGLTLVAQEVGATGFAIGAASIIPALIGFLVFNWPYGRIFLGDAGAYTLGHVLVWLAIGLAWLHPQVSALALSLMFFWPVADTFLAISRRMHLGQPVGFPDRLHYHQFVMRALILLSSGRMGKGAANSTTTLVLLPLVAAPIATGVYLWDRPLAALIAWACFGAVFTLSYVVGVRLFRNGRWRRIAAIFEIAADKLKTNQ